jgi:beta-phosphoglucomutase-like phosphatase (HAD superfamily)
MKYKGIIFDFNGVILWDLDWHIKSWMNVNKDLIGKEISKEDFYEISGRTNFGVFEYLTGRKPNKAELEELINEKEQKYRGIAIKQKDFCLSPGAEKLFNFLKESNIPFTIATSSEITNVEFYFKNLPLKNWFSKDEIVYDDGSFAGKPAPDIYLKAAKAIGLEPKECIVVEDAKSGIASAYAAGIGKIIGFISRTDDKILKSLPGVERVIKRLDEIMLKDFEE